MKNAIETNGSLYSGNSENMLILFKTLSQVQQLHSSLLIKITNWTNHNYTKEKENDSFLIPPMSIPTKPKARYNIPKKNLKSSREQTISGKKNHPRCSFCGRHSNIPMCSAISDMGICFSDKNMKNSVCSSIICMLIQVKLILKIGLCKIQSSLMVSQDKFCMVCSSIKTLVSKKGDGWSAAFSSRWYCLG